MIKLLSPAKINLFLEISGLLENGYHSIDTIFQAVDLYDIIYIDLRSDGKFILSSNVESLNCSQTNLCIKAAKAYFDKVGICDEGVEIFLHKVIPIQAGLGGGSSNAAAVLIGLNHLHENKLSEKELHEVAINLGADVPFFLLGGTALASGIGDKLKAMTSLVGYKFILCKPKFGFSTSDMFSIFDMSYKKYDFKNSSDLVKKLNNVELLYSDDFYNVFDKLVDNDEIDQIKSILSQHGAVTSVFSGSGSTIVGLFAQNQNTSMVIEELSNLNFIQEIFEVYPVDTAVKIVG